MHFDLKPISVESIPEALAKVERYRLLNEPSLAESICLDILAIVPGHQQALISMLLARTDHTTYCPYKGDCAYFSIPAGGEKTVNAVWTYETPYDAVKQIKNHLAFYTDRVESITEQAAN